MIRTRLQTKLFGDEGTLSLEHRCYNGICLFAGIGCWLACLNNTIIGIDWMLTLITFAIGATFLALYGRSRRRPTFQPLYGVFMANGVALLAATWFWNGGLSGPDTMVALAALVALLTVMDRSPYRNVGIVFVPLMSLLFLIEYFAPSLVLSYGDRDERFIDIYITFLVATFVITQIIVMILQAYRDERARADAMNRRISKNLEELQQTNRALANALSEVKTLSGLLPICASCQKIRDDRGYWDRIETYIQAHSEATFSHSLCPECAQRLYPDIFPEGEYPEPDSKRLTE